MAAETKETTSQCITRIKADYTDRLARAKADGKEKAILVYTRKLEEMDAGTGDLVDGCKLNDENIAGKQRLALNEDKITVYSSAKVLLDKIRSRTEK